MKLQTNAKRRFTGRWISLPRYERGAATILVVLLIGVGLVSASLGTMHMVRSTQERQMAARAQVNSQAGVWATVEAVRTYLQTLNKNQLISLTKNQVWTITGTDNLTQQAILTDIVPPIAPAVAYKVKAQLTATDTAAKSSSSLEVVYSVEPAHDGTTQLSGVLDFYNDLTATGGISLTAPAGKGLDFNVDGDFTATSAGISGTGFRNINVTGNILLDSQVAANVVRGRNITLTQSAKVTRAEAWGFPSGDSRSLGTEASKGKGFTCCGNITIGSWPTIAGTPVVDTAHANGKVVANAGEVTTILARGNVTLGGNGSDSVSALGDVEITKPKKAKNVIAGGNLTIKDVVGGTGSTLAAVGNVACTTANPGHFIKARLAANIQATCNGKPDASLVAPVITEVPQVKLVAPVVDAWALKAAANYALEFTSDKKVKVAVRNVNGIPDGDNYYLGHYGKKQVHLCKEVTVAANDVGTCATTGVNALAKADSMPFCINNNEDTTCITPDFANKLITIKADSTPAGMPAGVIWFDGTLSLTGGPFFNTFIVTQDITTSGAVDVYSVNYGSDYLINGSSDAVCKNQRASSTIFADYKIKYPKNFCSSTGAFVPQAIGNIALVAGGYNPASSPKTFTGGNITLTASSTIHGTVVAGNILRTEGLTTVYGYITAAGLYHDPTAINTVQQTLIVDLTKRPAAYTPEKVPDTDNSAVSTVTKASVLWSRYL